MKAWTPGGDEQSAAAASNAQKTITLRLSDLISITSLDILSAALEEPITPALRARIADSPRLSERAARAISSAADIPRHPALPDCPRRRMLHDDRTDDLSFAISATAAALCGDPIRRAITPEAAQPLRERFGDAAFAFVQSWSDLPRVRHARDIAGIGAGWLTLGAWLGSRPDAERRVLAIRFDAADLTRMQTKDDTRALADLFVSVTDRLFADRENGMSDVAG